MLTPAEEFEAAVTVVSATRPASAVPAATMSMVRLRALMEVLNKRLEALEVLKNDVLGKRRREAEAVQRKRQRLHEML